MEYSIYLIDDDWQKFLYIPCLIDCLNRKYSSINFVNGFHNLSKFDRAYAKSISLEKLQKEVSPLVENIIKDAGLIFNLLNDPNGIILIDFKLGKKSLETANNLKQILQEQTAQNVTTLAQAIFDLIADSHDFSLASVILAWCKIKDLKYIVISSIGHACNTELKELGIETHFVPFPNKALPTLIQEDKSSILNRTLDQLVDAVTKTISHPLTYIEFLHGMEELDTHNEKEKSFELLQRFLCIQDISELKSDYTFEALKTISGEVKGKSDESPAESLSYAGAWLLMLGKFRYLFPNDDWQTVFSIDEFIAASRHGRYCKLHPNQSKGIKRETLRVFGNFCDEVFIYRDRETEIRRSLEKVRIEVKQEGTQIKKASLSLKLNFPLGNFDRKMREDFESDGRMPSLYERIYEKSVKVALSGNPSQGGHGTSESIWQLWTLCSFSDVYNRDGGIFGTQHRMNIFKLDEKSCVIGWGTHRGTNRWIDLWSQS